MHPVPGVMLESRHQFVQRVFQAGGRKYRYRLPTRPGRMAKAETEKRGKKKAVRGHVRSVQLPHRPSVWGRGLSNRYFPPDISLSNWRSAATSAVLLWVAISSMRR